MLLLSIHLPSVTRRARQLAQKTAETRGPENIAADLIKRREEQQKAQTAARLAGGGATDEGEWRVHGRRAVCVCLGSVVCMAEAGAAG